MTDRIDSLTSRVERLEEKVETLSTSIQDLSASVDERFNAVDTAFVEQREYTEFAFSRLEAKMDAGFFRIDANAARLEAKMESGFTRIERKLDQFIDTQLQTNALVDRRLRRLES